jgi:hypothetical protein
LQNKDRESFLLIWDEKGKITLLRHDLILIPLKLFILGIWKENFDKKILEKRNPNLGITTLFRSRKPVDVIIITRGKQGYPLPQNPWDLAQGII